MLYYKARSGQYSLFHRAMSRGEYTVIHWAIEWLIFCAYLCVCVSLVVFCICIFIIYISFTFSSRPLIPISVDTRKKTLLTRSKTAQEKRVNTKQERQSIMSLLLRFLALFVAMYSCQAQSAWPYPNTDSPTEYPTNSPNTPTETPTRLHFPNCYIWFTLLLLSNHVLSF